MRSGRVSIIGAGPGDPELITLKALRRIQSGDILLYDRLVSPELLDYAKPGAAKVYCGKAPREHAMPQEQIQRLMIEYASAGHHVVRLKGGDPFVFGRGGEEALAMAAAGIPYEIVPGVTSAMGAAASAAIPLTHRGISGSCAIVTGSRCQQQDQPVRWDLLAGAVDTIVVYMGIGQLDSIRAALLQHGKAADTPVAIIERGTTSRQRIITGNLDNIEKIATAMNASNPALIIVGEVVKVREALLQLEAELARQTG
ncbi:uroporphyrinogen-III C-methyltransferase [Paenibacillus caui]|uniref:uroporphyrinogen-III C-methyltransferase n=1 Tax=Paenibacillus caui TaxID=2873927 RepID=UPI001CA7C6D2|nr:uroporphyrinogen-III C-methyltransferase [Paenibacillus caui]